MAASVNNCQGRMMLKHRLLTAGLLIPLAVLAVIFLPNSIFAIMTALIITLGANEWARLSGFTHNTTQYIYAGTMFVLCMILQFYSVRETNIIIIQFATVWWLLALILVTCYQVKIYNLPKHRILLAFIGFIVLVPSWLSIVILHQEQQGVVLVLFLFAIIWIADSIAYFAGQRWGKHRLANRVSPGKSWEGAFFALLSSIVIAVLYSVYHEMSIKGLVVFLLLCLLTVICSILGDLFESMVKRIADMKDSGEILPGHGGILDRIDSMTAAAPVFFCALYWTGYWS